MLCSRGMDLFLVFQQSAAKRASLRDDMLLSSEQSVECEEMLYTAKVEYGDAFVLFLTHQGTCAVCSAAADWETRLRFASF